jgi:ATP-binding cassette subfamily F protein 3
LQKLDPKATEKELRNFLGGFDFRGDKVLEPVQPFSGGEKARLVLALLVYQNPNLLLLDEPTNHLDLEMRQALSVALQDYEGAIVLVSHDRHLLRTVADQFLLVSDKQCRPFDGDLDDYRLWLSEQKKNINNQNDAAASGLSRKNQRKLDAERRQQHKPLLDALKKAEKAVENYHAEQRRLELQLSDPEIYADGQKSKLKILLAQKAETDKALADAEAAWLAVEEQLSATNITA